jgi:hypothetical protein
MVVDMRFIAVSQTLCHSLAKPHFEKSKISRTDNID